MYQHILAATDGSKDSQRAVEEALLLAEEHGARLTVLTVIRGADAGALDTPGIDAAESALRESERGRGKARIRKAVARLSETSVEVRTEIVRGVPHRAICDYADSEGSDLVVLGSAGSDSLADAILGSTTERIARQCGTPVHVV